MFELFSICVFYFLEICKRRERQPGRAGGEKMSKGNETGSKGKRLGGCSVAGREFVN